jgi:hypothetical protein
LSAREGGIGDSEVNCNCQTLGDKTGQLNLDKDLVCTLLQPAFDEANCFSFMVMQ